MLSYQQISSEISRLLAQAYPDYGVYANALPQDAQYPCFLIQSIATDIQDASCFLVSITEYITLSCIIADDTLNGMEQLTNMQLGVLNLLRQGYLSVSDRSISVRAGTGAVSYTHLDVYKRQGQYTGKACKFYYRYCCYYGSEITFAQ